MSNGSQIREKVDAIVREEGLQLFDLQIPAGHSGIFRVFIWKGKVKGQGVTVEDCARVSRRISDLENIDEILPGDVRIEVSSPGVNRELRTSEHFAGAIGERVRISLRGPSGTARTVIGTLCGFDGSLLTVEEDGTGKTTSFPLTEVFKAKVEFIFD